jgi:hypothetical protein
MFFREDWRLITISLRTIGIIFQVRAGLDERDECEFFQEGSLLLGVIDEEVYKVRAGLETSVIEAD